jgi:hypothetical protein
MIPHARPIRAVGPLLVRQARRRRQRRFGAAGEINRRANSEKILNKIS